MHIISKSLLFILLVSVLALLTGCPTPINPQQPPHKNQSLGQTQDAEFWLMKAKSATAPEKYSFILNAIASMIEQKQFSYITEPLAQIGQAETELALNQEQHQRFLLYQAIFLTQMQDYTQALNQFEQLKPIQFSTGDEILRLKTYAEAYLQTSNFVEAIKIRIPLGTILTAAEYQENQDAIWNILKLPTENYFDVFTQSTANDPVLNGWIQLAIIQRQTQGQPRQLLKAFSLWKNRFTQHPAAVVIPTELARMSQAKFYDPKTVDVLLPQTGIIAPSAKVIRQGIEAAFFQSPIATKPSLHFYNSNVDDIGTVYQKALAEGADFILGPLNKDKIVQFAQQKGDELPAITLNIVDLETTNTGNIYQFGLPIENETNQISQRLYDLNLKKIAVLVPDNHLGDKALNAFKNRFEALGGEIVIQKHYKDESENSDVIQSLLGIDESFKRKNKLERLFGRALEFDPRRRQDIDAIFLYANPQNGRRLKPLLDYYFARNIPVYATSKIYSGKNNPELDKDMESINFLSFPWLVDADVQTSSNTWQPSIPSSISSESAYLFAFGVDAYQLIDQVSVLEVFPEQYFNGLSGKLSMNSVHQINNTLTWSHFHNGLVTLTQEDNPTSNASDETTKTNAVVE